MPVERLGHDATTSPSSASAPPLRLESLGLSLGLASEQSEVESWTLVALSARSVQDCREAERQLDRA